MDNKTKDELTSYALDLLYDHLYATIMKNLSKLEEPDRYYNWYKGYTEIAFPYSDYYGVDTNIVKTAATTGTISTQYFGQKFNADKVERMLYYYIQVSPPDSLSAISNVHLHFEVEYNALKHLTNGNDQLDIGPNINVENSHTIKNFTTSYWQSMKLSREVIQKDVEKQNLNFMPGFKFTWYYSGLNEVQPDPKYSDYYHTKSYVR